MKKGVKEKQQEEIFPRLVSGFLRNSRVFLVVLVCWGFCAALMLFDVKLSTGGDDATYILQANDFIKKGMLPIGFKSPGYPMLLSILVFLFGMNILVLKLSSLAFYIGSLISFYVIFRNRLEKSTFLLSIVLFASNLLVLQYACHTYSEMAFLFIELWVFHALFTVEERQQYESVLAISLVALLAMVGFYIRAIGATLPIAIVLWIFVARRWKQGILFIIVCAFLYTPMKVLEFTRGQPVLAQSSDIFKINPYNPTLGMETFEGFLIRIRDNLFVYVNTLIPKALGLPHKEEHAIATGILIHDMTSILGILFSLILFVGIVVALWKKERVLGILGLYAFVYILSISFALQTLFVTPRMLVPMVPLFIPLFLYGLQHVLHRVLRTRNTITSSLKSWYTICTVALCVSTMVYLGDAVKHNLPILKANLKGDEFAGYTPDWVNYLKACRWIAKNLPKDSVGIICRKAELFRIYTDDYKTHGVYSIETTDPDTLVNHWRAWGMTHILYDNFQWSSTLRRYVQPALQKYPAMFEVIHQEGHSSPSFVLAIHYDRQKDNN
ncbi:MAG: hypothetical protein N3A63_06710 [Bacteroidetes bacterium]|nr:hypothetical protein [Bacteroidota bacterium]